MNPIFALNYPELVVAEYLQAKFTKGTEHGVLIPLSGQQKGFDLALTRRHAGTTKVATFQVKSSRTYAGTAGLNKKGVRTFAHYTWLKRFAVPKQADFFVVIAFYAPAPTSMKGTISVWKTQMLLFTHAEMTALLASLVTKKARTPDSSFGFGFDTPGEAFLTRGNPHAKTFPDHSDKVLHQRLTVISAAL